MSIASEISRIQTAKADIKTAIEAKGVTVPSNTKIDGYANLIDDIPTGGGGGGGFRCTNKIFLSNEPLLYANGYYSHQYTFDGTLDSAALCLFEPSGGGSERCIMTPTIHNGNYVGSGSFRITADTIMFLDKFCEPLYGTGNDHKLISNKFTITDTDLSASVEIDNTGLLVVNSDYDMDPGGGLSYSIGIIFKGTDGSYDFDMIGLYTYYDD